MAGTGFEPVVVLNENPPVEGAAAREIPVEGAAEVDPIENPVEVAVGAAGVLPNVKPVDGVVEPIEKPVDGAVEPIEKPVDGAVDPIENPVEGAAGAAVPKENPEVVFALVFDDPVDGAVVPMENPVEGAAVPPKLKVAGCACPNVNEEDVAAGCAVLPNVKGATIKFPFILVVLAGVLVPN